jgi:hypothetical protein
LKRLLARWWFDIPDELKNDIDWFIKENDSVVQFLESWDVTVWEWLFIPNNDLYLAYTTYCRNNWFKPLWLIKLWNRLLDKGFHRHTNWKERGIRWLWDTSY